MPVETVYSSALDMVFKLGRKSNPNPRRALRLEDVLDPARAQFPDKTNRRDKAQKSIHTMLGNDRAGDCVIASKLHIIGVQSANDATEVTFSTQDALDMYYRICGPGDNGCMIDSVLDYQAHTGLNGHKIAGWARFDCRNPEMNKAAVHYFGGVSYGINCPAAWANGFRDGVTWDNTNSPSVGGHDIAGIDYDADGVYCSTWAGLAHVTWKALANQRIFEEAYVSIGQDWLNTDQKTPAGLDLGTLQTIMRALEQGTVPPEPNPQPPGPGPSPVPADAILLALKDIPKGAYNLQSALRLEADAAARSFNWDSLVKILQALGYAADVIAEIIDALKKRKQTE